MFLIIPLSLILASVIGISIIIYRKMPYLNKLTPETHVGGSILDDLFPEFSEGFKSLKLREYGDLWLLELEKFLRRLRVISLKIDRISDAWIKKIRNGNVSRATNSLAVEKAEVLETPATKIQPTKEMIMEEMKKEEQRLIIEIAKNPKDFRLYEALGDLYTKMDNYSDAKESFEAAMELNPQNEELQKKHSKILEKVIV